MKKNITPHIFFLFFWAVIGIAASPATARAVTYQVVDSGLCNNYCAPQLLGGSCIMHCNPDESCTVNPSTSSGYLCVKSTTVQSGTPSTNSFTTPDCGGQCPANSQCTANTLAIPTVYFCSSQTQPTTQQPPTTDCASQPGGCQLQYAPLEPLSSPITGQTGGTVSGLASYLNYLFPILISIGALLGVVAFTVGGVVYMTSSVTGDKSKAIERMKASVWGLLLLVASVLILQIVNPQLVVFNLQSLGQAGQTTPGSYTPGFGVDNGPPQP